MSLIMTLTLALDSQGGGLNAHGHAQGVQIILDRSFAGY
jgi:hypothetical protein